MAKPASRKTIVRYYAIKRAARKDSWGIYIERGIIWFRISTILSGRYGSTSMEGGSQWLLQAVSTRSVWLVSWLLAIISRTTSRRLWEGGISELRKRFFCHEFVDVSVVCFVCRNASHLFLGYWRYCCSYIVTSSYTCCIRSAISSHTIHNMILSRLSVCGFIFGVSLWNNILWRSLQPALGRCFEDLFATGTKKKRIMISCEYSKCMPLL